MQKSNLYFELNTDSSATGSASWSFGKAQVVASVYGPKEASMANELTHRAFLDVNVLPVSGQHTPNESAVELFICQFLERLIEVKELPRCQVTYFVYFAFAIRIHHHSVTPWEIGLA